MLILIYLQRLLLIWQKKCFFCGSSNVFRNGLRGRKQQYKCKDCGRQFLGGLRRDKSQVISDYIEGKQTRRQLADKYGVSVRTIERDLEGMRYVQKVSKDKKVVIQMDTTYWGRDFGLMVIKDAYRNKILWRKYVRYETIAGYIEGVSWLREHGFRIYGVVIDGLRGLAEALKTYPVQHCQFHQMMTVRHYLTGNPDIEASRELLSLAGSMTRMDKESFIGAFNGWYVKYKDVLNERVQDRRMKTPPYMRPRLRSAYLSLKRNMGRLWTFYDYKDRIIPNTNNGLEAVFADIKSKVRVHSGLTREHRIKLIDEYISRHY